MWTTLMTRLTSLFSDWKNQLSWGRVCAAVALVIAVILSFRPGPDIKLIELWLGVACGNYGASKLTEVVSIIKNKVQNGSQEVDNTAG